MVNPCKKIQEKTHQKLLFSINNPRMPSTPSNDTKSYICRNEIYQKFTPPDLWAKKFYILKVRELRLFLLTVKHLKSINISRCLKKLTDCVKLFMKMRCFLEKLTQLAQILHKRWTRRTKWTTKSIALMIVSAKTR